MRLMDWQKMKFLKRELQPYRYHVIRGGKVTFLECRPGQTLNLFSGMGVQKVPHWRLLPLWEYIHPFFMRTVDLIKTNQSYRADIFVRMARRWHKPILLRCGMVYGERVESEFGLTPEIDNYQKKEAWAFRNSTLCVVPTQELAEWVVNRYQTRAENIRIVPNFVDTSLFISRVGVASQSGTVISVGRLHAIKRFDLLIKACQIAGVSVRIAGEGPEMVNLLNLARELRVPLELVGQIDNQKLPEYYASAQVFVICSLREGHPKALIEAMSCGRACVCVDAPGIRNLVKDGINGLLVEPDPKAIAAAICLLRDNQDLRQKLGEHAREYVKNNFDIHHVLEMDADVIDEVYRIYHGCSE